MLASITLIMLQTSAAFLIIFLHFEAPSHSTETGVSMEVRGCAIKIAEKRLYAVEIIF